MIIPLHRMMAVFLLFDVLACSVSSLARSVAGTSTLLPLSSSPLFGRCCESALQDINSTAATRCHAVTFRRRPTNAFGSATRTATTHYFCCHSHNSSSALRVTSSTLLSTKSIAVNRIHAAVNGLILLRGGGPSIGVNSVGRLLTGMFNKFARFVGASKIRCLMLLFCSIMLESYATTLSKKAKDTGKIFLFVRACSIYIMCMIGFNISLARIDVSVAYALWGAIGTILVTTAGVLFFGESLDLIKVLCLAMIMSGVVGLNLR